MHLTNIKITQLHIYFLPLAAFFILISSAATNLFIILAVLSSILVCIKNNHLRKLFQRKSFIFCTILYLLLLCSSFYSIADTEQIIEVAKKYIKFLYIPILFYSIKQYDSSNFIIRFFIVGATIILFMSYMKYFKVFNFETFYDFLRIINLADTKEKIVINETAIFQHYIIQGIVFSFFSFLCLILGIKKKNIIYVALAAISFINVLFMNDSRTAYILLTFLLLLCFLFLIKSIKLRLGFLLVIAVLMFTQFSDNLKHRLDLLDTDISYIKEGNYNSSLGLRLLWSKVGISNLQNQPIFGSGAGSFKKNSQTYFKESNIPLRNNYITNNPHNEFISISSQLGITGLFLYLAFIFYLFTEARKDTLSIGIVSMVPITSLFNSAFYDNMLGLFLVIALCLTQESKLKI